MPTLKHSSKMKQENSKKKNSKMKQEDPNFVDLASGIQLRIRRMVQYLSTRKDKGKPMPRKRRIHSVDIELKEILKERGTEFEKEVDFKDELKTDITIRNYSESVEKYLNRPEIKNLKVVNADFMLSVSKINSARTLKLLKSKMAKNGRLYLTVHKKDLANIKELLTLLGFSEIKSKRVGYRDVNSESTFIYYSISSKKMTEKELKDSGLNSTDDIRPYRIVAINRKWLFMPTLKHSSKIKQENKKQNSKKIDFVDLGSGDGQRFNLMLRRMLNRLVGAPGVKKRGLPKSGRAVHLVGKNLIPKKAFDKAAFAPVADFHEVPKIKLKNQELDVNYIDKHVIDYLSKAEPRSLKIVNADFLLSAMAPSEWVPLIGYLKQKMTKNGRIYLTVHKLHLETVLKVLNSLGFSEVKSRALKKSELVTDYQKRYYDISEGKVPIYEGERPKDAKPIRIVAINRLE